MLPLLGVTVGLLGAYLLLQQVINAQDTISPLEDQLQLVQTRIQAIQQENVRRGQLQRIKGEFDHISGLRGVVIGDWELIEQTAGEDIQLSSFTITDTDVSMNISADSFDQVERFVEDLRKLPRFGKIELPQETGGASRGQRISQGLVAQFATKK